MRSAFPLRAALAVWPLALVAAYAVHLPVVYQHGRYQMPILPSLIALATPGAARLLVAGERRLLARIGALALAAAALVSLGRAPQIYASDVRTIDGDQVSTARWLRTHTPPGSLVATHDIGAIGYFADRPVLDMAGLIDPQVIPLLGDQRALERFLRRHRAAYVAMFVDWFPPPAVLAHDLAGRAVHRATAAGPQAGPGATFVVYRTGW